MRANRIAVVAAALTAVVGLPGCGGEASNALDQEGATYADRSGQEEFCGLVATTRPQLGQDLTSSDAETVQPVMNALADIASISPEEVKGDWADMRALMQLVVDASGDPASVDEESLAQADQAFGELSARVAQVVEQTCGLTLE